MMNPQLFTNVKIFDGTGAPTFVGEALVDGNLIRAVARGNGGIPRESYYDVIDGKGMTLMPGLVEAHAHVTYSNMAQFSELGLIPIEEHTILALQNVKLMLDSGFTSLYSAASAKFRLEAVLRDAIDAGKFPGPRMRAASPELTATGGLGDERQYHTNHQGFELIADGPDEIRRTVRTLIREGVDTIKMNISGDMFAGRQGFARRLSYTEAEVAAAAEEAHMRGAWLSCHARADAAVKLALKYDFRVIYHCDFIEGETYDLLEAKRDSVFLAPAIGVIYATAYEAEPWGITREFVEKSELFTMIEQCPKVYGELRKRGLRVLPGGDYGFAWNPIGTNARDLEHFVNILGFTPADALMAATKWGGEIMDIPNLGLVSDGYLADLLLVDGDPVENIKLLQDRDNIKVVMKDGVYYKRLIPTPGM
ncbi:MULTISPECIES: amidohydrolase family protein [Paraburkholderia]|jgi:imidazolonepropionase-like amidohydrolase|uniref:Imidazolonepropionase n=4 Tax=Paraburkholderia TaxID=1822464 RepID=A0A1N6K0Z8_9BURK|nr:amidohydrolase family protein [Paraburkholderia phenazinium]SIO42056.1 Imidazolonepropionase [Paraburkholderia phenazinium]SIO50006.1 Imidazolonepropionase [Paraburkholderia phenazinium]